MPWKDKEKQKAYAKAYYSEHKEERAAYKKVYDEVNEEKRKATAAAYSKTPARKKSYRLYHWRRMGIIPDPLTWDELYDNYLSTTLCADCDCELESGCGARGRTLDHDHETGLVRDVVCRGCNVRRG